MSSRNQLQTRLFWIPLIIRFLAQHQLAYRQTSYEQFLRGRIAHHFLQLWDVCLLPNVFLFRLALKFSVVLKDRLNAVLKFSRFSCYQLIYAHFYNRVTVSLMVAKLWIYDAINFARFSGPSCRLTCAVCTLYVRRVLLMHNWTSAEKRCKFGIEFAVVKYRPRPTHCMRCCSTHFGL